MRSCPLCEKSALESAEDHDLGVCGACRKAHGPKLEPDTFPESRRPPRPCERCGHEEILRGLVFERSGEYHHPRPLAASFARTIHGSLFGDFVSEGAPLGRFETYVCRSCGFVEWYALEPERIPVGRIFGTELVRAAKKPYR